MSNDNGPSQCSWFVPGAGRKGNRCKTCHQKECHHDHQSAQHDGSTTQTSPPPSSSTSNQTVQMILDRYGVHWCQARTPLDVAQSEASAGFRKTPSQSLLAVQRRSSLQLLNKVWTRVCCAYSLLLLTGKSSLGRREERQQCQLKFSSTRIRSSPNGQSWYIDDDS